MKIHEGQSLWLNSPPVPSPYKIEHRTELPRKSQQLLSSSSLNRFVHQTQLTFQWRFHSPVAPTPGCWWSRPTPGIAAWQRNSDRRLGIRSGLVQPGQEAKPQSGPPYAQPWWGSSEYVLLEETPPCSEEKRLFSWPALRVMIPSRSWAIEPCRRAQGNGGLLPPLLLSLPPSPRWRKGGEGQSGPLVECETREKWSPDTSVTLAEVTVARLMSCRWTRIDRKWPWTLSSQLMTHVCIKGKDCAIYP